MAASAGTQGDSIVVITEPAGTYGPYYLLGGVYGITLVQVGAGAVTLKYLAPDGTAVTVGTGLVAAGSSYQSSPLPAGQYEIVTTAATSATAAVSPVSQNRT
jgi:hypothetical protein